MAHSVGVVLTTPPPPGLQEATKNSTIAWQEHLESLFHHAKDRFPDVVWELTADEEDPGQPAEEVWGHKGIYIFSPILYVVLSNYLLQQLCTPVRHPVSKIDIFLLAHMAHPLLCPILLHRQVQIILQILLFLSVP